MRIPHFIDYFLYGWVTCLLVKLYRGDNSMDMSFIVAVFAFFPESLSWVLTYWYLKFLIGLFGLQACWNFQPSGWCVLLLLLGIWIDVARCVESCANFVSLPESFPRCTHLSGVNGISVVKSTLDNNSFLFFLFLHLPCACSSFFHLIFFSPISNHWGYY